MDDSQTQAVDTSLAKDNAYTLKKLVLVVVLMFGFGFAMVPFYKQICEVAGLNNILDPDEVKNTQVDLSRTVRVQFDGNVHQQLAWKFRPLQTELDVHPGAVQQALFEVMNETDKPVLAQAIPSYAPERAGAFFKKLECFCFTQQKLLAHEKRVMPVVFVVDPKLPKDIVTITLSYTFFELGQGAVQAAPKTAL